MIAETVIIFGRMSEYGTGTKRRRSYPLLGDLISSLTTRPSTVGRRDDPPPASLFCFGAMGATLSTRAQPVNDSSVVVGCNDQIGPTIC